MTDPEIVLWLATVALSTRFGWILREMKYKSDEREGNEAESSNYE